MPKVGNRGLPLRFPSWTQLHCYEFGARKPCRINSLLPLKFRTRVSLIQNIRMKNLETYLPSNSHENQSEDDNESTDDSFDQFTDHQVHLSASRQWLCFVWHLIEIVTIAKLLIIVHVFVLEHEKQTVCYIQFHTTFEGNRKNRFFSPIYFVGTPFFCLFFLPEH